jgi:hypothetical protein
VFGALVVALACGVLAPRSSAAERAAAECQAQLLGDRILAAISLRGFVEEETLRLLRLGMRGRVRIDAAVVRKSWGVFEHTTAARVVESQLSSARDKQDLLVDNRTRAPAAGPIRFERMALRLKERDVPVDRLILRVTVQLQVVTVSSLSDAAAWATESTDDETSSSLLTRGLLAAVANDLTRSAECSCAVTAARTESAEPR